MDIDLTTLVRDGTPQSLRELPLPRALRALVLAPHPDDFDEIGVTLRHLHRNGHSLDVGVVATGSGVEDAYRPGLTLADKTELRKQEQQRSLRFFGLPGKCLTFLSLANDSEDQPIDTPGNRSAVEAFVAAKAPDIVFLPHGNDTNRGHRVMYSLLKQVGQRLGPSFVMFLNRAPKTIGMRTDLYMPFDQDEAGWKAQLLRFHDSQHQRNLRTRKQGFDDRILNVNRAIARNLSLKWEYAEAFEIERLDTPEKRIPTTESNATSG